MTYDLKENRVELKIFKYIYIFLILTFIIKIVSFQISTFKIL